MDSDSRKDHHPNLISEIFDASLFGEPEAKTGCPVEAQKSYIITTPAPIFANVPLA